MMRGERCGNKDLRSRKSQHVAIWMIEKVKRILQRFSNVDEDRLIRSEYCLIWFFHLFFAVFLLLKRHSFKVSHS